MIHLKAFQGELAANLICFELCPIKTTLREKVETCRSTRCGPRRCVHQTLAEVARERLAHRLQEIRERLGETFLLGA